MLAERIITLSTGLTEPCPYHLGEGIAEELPGVLSQHEFDSVYLVTSDRLRALFGHDLERVFAAAGIPVTVLSVAEGERNKSWRALSRLSEQLVAAGLTKDSIVIAAGGGMITNLVELAASLIYRGVRHVEVPTTLLAITDGSLSNKQAINGAAGKNQFGVYHAPLFIWSDVAYVRHEPLRQLKSAVVEGTKNGLVNDPGWVARLAELLDPSLTIVRDDPLGFAREIVESKLAILRQDPTERAFGVVLEYGHTVGHAVEWLARGGLLHGEAVGIGMCAAARLGARLGITPPDVLDRQVELLRGNLGCPVQVPEGITSQRILETILSDNKRRGGEDIHFILLEAIGKPHNPNGEFTTPVPRQAVTRMLAEG